MAASGLTGTTVLAKEPPSMDVPELAALMQGRDKATIAAALDEARGRTWLLVDGLADADLCRAPCDYLSPPAWDLGHIANFEELWLVQELLARDEMHAGYNAIYNAFAHPRSERPQLRLLDREGLRQYHDAVRQDALAALDQCTMADRLSRDGFVHWMLVLHEHQHQETILQALQMIGPGAYRPPPARALPAPHARQGPWIDVHEGPFTMGTAHMAGTYDNEAPAHVVHVPAFQIARHPVTCGEYLRFMEDGGYDDEQWWSQRGRRWLQETQHHAPLYWDFDTRWWRTSLLGRRPVGEVEDEILCHVSYFEAEAYAAWAGARLPTEAEWEKACRHGASTEDGVASRAGAGAMGAPVAGAATSAQTRSVAKQETSRATSAHTSHEAEASTASNAPARVSDAARNPWGNEPATTELANIDQLGLQPSRVGAYPRGASPCGAQHMIGDVWEWTSSPFEPYPGFEAFPYPEYSEVFFGGDYRVLRGGSWATRAGCATGTFRNWDHPYRRQIFSGIRLARGPP